MTRYIRAFVFVLLAMVALPATAQDPFFDIDGLNGGLGERPDAMDLRTPRSTLESFLVAADEGRWDDAAHALDLSDLDDAAQAGEGPILAAQLHSVIERKAVLDWSSLNDRPDGLQPLGGQSQATAGDPRRSFLIRELDLDPVPGAIRLNRVKPGEDADPVWVFPRETVADIPAMYRAYGPSAFESKLPAILLAQGPASLMWWEWIGLPLLVVIAGVLGWFTARLFAWIRTSSDNGMVRGVTHALKWPAVIAAVTTLVAVVSRQLFVFSGQIDTVLSPLIAIGYVTATLMVVIGVLDAVLDNLVSPGDDIDLTVAEQQEARSTATKINATRRILTILVFLIGAGIVLSTADVFRGVGLSILASASALTIILGFAARRVLGNIIASLQIAMNQSARVGDRIMYKGELCYVERIQMTYVQLRNWDSTRLIVPVEEFISEPFENWSIEDPSMLRILKFKLRPAIDLDAVRDAFVDVAREVSEDEDHAEFFGDFDSVKMDVTGQDVFGIDVWFYVPCTDPNNSWAVSCAVRERLIGRLADMEGDGDARIFPDPAAAEAA
ncbi:mechanosensitive ion channel family protein [Jannaschia sp. LMIT008]|uniref:mechanosensitive ion channel family protein n=1 Tax=Jannaschia maritima TaxID=3032585 RepID=UPI002811CCC4|nr:mechanosensitive ion channel domain-containing protein [Jannaschia sp. LMIT008]